MARAYNFHLRRFTVAVDYRFKMKIDSVSGEDVQSGRADEGLLLLFVVHRGGIIRGGAVDGNSGSPAQDAIGAGCVLNPLSS